MTAFYNECDPFPAGKLRRLIERERITPGTVDERSITEVTGDDIKGHNRCHLFAGVAGWELALELVGWGADPVWTGSCPCQPFSCAGYGGGESDERHLWPEMFRLIKEARPPVVFGEQVPNLEWWDVVADDLESIGYATRAEVLDASQHGASHKRRRLYWAASDSDGERQPQPWIGRQDAGHNEAGAFGEANRLVDAVRRGALPFLCSGHDGVPIRLGRDICRALGNAIVPVVAAEFIRSFMECQA